MGRRPSRSALEFLAGCSSCPDSEVAAAQILVCRFSVMPSGLEGWFDHWRSRTRAIPTPTAAPEMQCLVLSLALSSLQPPFPRLGCWQGNPKISKARKLLSPLGLEESRYEMMMPELWSQDHQVTSGATVELLRGTRSREKGGCLSGSSLVDLDSKESTCNAGDSGSIPGSGRSPGEGNGRVGTGESGLVLCQSVQSLSRVRLFVTP